MIESPILAELSVVQDDKGVQVEFTKIGGIISHTISLVNAGERTPVLTSCINELAQPCFTELHQQGETLFLTGANGAGHWSMSVQKSDMTFAGVASPTEETLKLFEKRFGLNAPSELNSGRFSFGQVLYFDIACRLKKSVSSICSKYIARDNFECSSTIWACSARDRSDVARGIVLLGGPMEGRDFSLGPSYLMDCTSERELRFSPVNTTVETFPTTMRWSYAIWRE